jgi:hypothetical protein
MEFMKPNWLQDDLTREQIEVKLRDNIEREMLQAKTSGSTAYDDADVEAVVNHFLSMEVMTPEEEELSKPAEGKRKTGIRPTTKSNFWQPLFGLTQADTNKTFDVTRAMKKGNPIMRILGKGALQSLETRGKERYTGAEASEAAHEAAIKLTEPKYMDGKYYLTFPFTLEETEGDFGYGPDFKGGGPIWSTSNFQVLSEHPDLVFSIEPDDKQLKGAWDKIVSDPSKYLGDKYTLFLQMFEPTRAFFGIGQK